MRKNKFELWRDLEVYRPFVESDSLRVINESDEAKSPNSRCWVLGRWKRFLYIYTSHAKKNNLRFKLWRDPKVRRTFNPPAVSEVDTIFLFVRERISVLIWVGEQPSEHKACTLLRLVTLWTESVTTPARESHAEGISDSPTWQHSIEAPTSGIAGRLLTGRDAEKEKNTGIFDSIPTQRYHL